MATKHIKRCSTSSFISEWDTTVHIRLTNIKIKALSQKCSADAHVPLGSRSSDGAWSFYVEVVLNGPVSLELLIWIPDPKPVVLHDGFMEHDGNLWPFTEQTGLGLLWCGGVTAFGCHGNERESVLVCVSGFLSIGSLHLGQICIFCQAMLWRVTEILPVT